MSTVGIIATIGGFLFGYDTANIGSALPFIPYHLGGLILAFPVWQTGIGLGWIMVCFAAIAVIAIAFVYRSLPETKNHSVDEVTELYERAAAGESVSRLTSQDADAAHA